MRREVRTAHHECLEMALKGLSAYAYPCLLIGHDQTCRGRALTAEFDPRRASECFGALLAFPFWLFSV